MPPRKNIELEPITKPVLWGGGNTTDINSLDMNQKLFLENKRNPDEKVKRNEKDILRILRNISRFGEPTKCKTHNTVMRKVTCSWETLLSLIDNSKPKNYKKLLMWETLSIDFLILFSDFNKDYNYYSRTQVKKSIKYINGKIKENDHDHENDIDYIDTNLPKLTPLNSDEFNKNLYVEKYPKYYSTMVKYLKL